MSTKIRISADDACASDVRLAELCQKYEIECVFYWPVEWKSLAYDKGYKPLTFWEANEIASEFEIGSHTITHRLLTQIPIKEAQQEIQDSWVMLHNLFGDTPTKFCPPRGYTNDELTEFTLMHYESQRLTKAPNLVHIHPDSGANYNKPWRDAITSQTEELWCHSWELDKYNLWEELEEYLVSLA